MMPKSGEGGDYNLTVIIQSKQWIYIIYNLFIIYITLFIFGITLLMIGIIIYTYIAIIVYFAIIVYGKGNIKRRMPHESKSLWLN